MARYRVVVDRVTCISCGSAPAMCPEIFEIGSDNYKDRVVDRYSVKTDESVSIGEVPEELYGCAKSGEDVCPVNAIKVVRID